MVMVMVMVMRMVVGMGMVMVMEMVMEMAIYLCNDIRRLFELKMRPQRQLNDIERSDPRHLGINTNPQHRRVCLHFAALRDAVDADETRDPSRAYTIRRQCV